MKKKALLSFILLGTGLLLMGCQKEIAGPEVGEKDLAAEVGEKDLAALRELIASEPLFTSDGMTLNDGDVVSFSSGSLGKVTTPIYPRGWGRRITSVSRDVVFDQVSDTVIVATITHTITGEVKIAAKYSLQDTSITIITKPLSETTVRKVKFHRIRRTDDPKQNWQPREVSGVKGGTQNSQVVINRIVVTIGSDTVNITDPTEYFMKLGKFGGREVPIFGNTQAIKVRVTITSSQADTDFVSLHRPGMMMGMNNFKPAHLRMQLVQQTVVTSGFQRVYEHSWNGHFPGRHHVMISALTRQSLFDDLAPFSSKVWGVPYIVQ